MANKREMSNKELELYNELNKLAKRANQRLLRMERLTKKKGLFAAKQLYDYLESVEGLSEKGRVRVSKSFSESQMVAIIKAAKNFLEDTKYSLTGELKKQKQEVEKSIGKRISWSSLSTIYIARELYKWADEEFGSKFWQDFAPLVFEQSKDEWIDYCLMYVDPEKVNDVTIKNRLKALYDYLRK